MKLLIEYREHFIIDMARGGSIRLLTLLIIFFNNEFAAVLAGGYGGGGGGGFGGGYGGGGSGGGYGGGFGGGYGGGYGGAYSSASASTSVGDAGNTGSGNNVFIYKDEQPAGNFEGNPFLSNKGVNHGGGQGDVSVSVHKEINLNGIKEGVHGLLGGILGGVSQLGDALAQGGRHPSSGVGGDGCQTRKCQNNPTGSIGNSAAASGASSFAGSSFVGFEASGSVPQKHEKHHHTHHTFSPDVSTGPQIREQPNNRHAAGGVSIGGTFGINNAGDQKPTTNNVQYPHGTSNEGQHVQGIVPSVVVHKEITVGVGGTPSGSAGGFGGSYGNIGFNSGKPDFTGNDNLSDKSKKGCSSGTCGNGNPHGNIGVIACTSGSCAGSEVYGGAFNGAGNPAVPSVNVGAHAGNVGLELGKFILGADRGNALQKGSRPGCSGQSCGNASPQGNYSYNYSYGGSSSYATAYSTSYSSSSAASGSHGREGITHSNH